MYILFFILSIASLICLAIGAIKPSVVKMKSRKVALYVFGGATILLFILFAIGAPPLEKTSAPVQTAVTEIKNDSSASLATSTAVATTSSVVAETKTSAPPSPLSTSSQLGTRTQTSGCTANQTLPDPECTPGAVLTIDKSVICVAGYTKTVRDVPDSVRQAVFKEYSIDYSLHSNYEVDHLISLELGGSNDISNLFPEGYSILHGALEKDKFENYLHSQICDGAMAVQTAQYQIATNWLKYYTIAFPSKTSASSQTQTTVAPVSDSGPQVKKSSSGICHEKGTTYYARTENYTPYTTIQACLDSGGRLPK